MKKFPYPKEQGAGVYEIRCTATDKMYIGSTRNLTKRLSRHVYDLRHGKHHSPHLQRAWNLHGEAAFILSVLEVFPPDVTDAYQIEREQHWLNVRRSYEPEHGYNILKMAFSRSGHKVSETGRRNMHKAGTGRVLSEEWKANIRQAHQGSKSHLAVLTEEQVTCIKQRLSEGERVPQLAVEYGLDRSTLYLIARGKTWAHIRPDLSTPQQQRGERHHNSRLTARDVLSIRERLGLGDPVPQIARDYGVHVGTIRDIHKEKTWKHLTTTNTP